MFTESNIELGERASGSEDKKLLALFFPEDPKDGYLSFHNKILLAPSKQPKRDIVFAKLLNVDALELLEVRNKTDNDRYSKVADDFFKKVTEDFVRVIIFPALKCINKDGIGINMLALIQGIAKCHGYIIRSADMYSLNGLIDIDTFDCNVINRRLVTLRALTYVLKPLPRERNSEKETHELLLEKWGNALCPKQGYHPLFIAYELLCACIFLIRCKGKPLSDYDNKIEGILEPRKTSVLNKLSIAINRGNISNEEPEKINNSGNVLGKLREDDRKFKKHIEELMASWLQCLKEMLIELKLHVDAQDPIADRVYVAVMAKLYYLYRKDPTGEPAGKDPEKIEQFLTDLDHALECLDNGLECKQAIKEALDKFKSSLSEQEQKVLALSRGTHKSLTSTEIEVLKRCQYGEDFYEWVDPCMVKVLEKFYTPEYDKYQREMLRIVLDSWFTMRLRGCHPTKSSRAFPKQYTLFLGRDSGKRKTENTNQSLPGHAMRKLRDQGVKNKLPVLVDIYNATPEEKERWGKTVKATTKNGQ